MINSSKFHIDRKTGSISGEASELGTPMFEQVSHKDQQIPGIKMLGNKAGTITEWYLADTKSCDGDLLCWILFPTDVTLEVFPNISRWTMTVYND